MRYEVNTYFVRKKGPQNTVLVVRNKGLLFKDKYVFTICKTNTVQLLFTCFAYQVKIFLFHEVIAKQKGTYFVHLTLYVRNKYLTKLVQSKYFVCGSQQLVESKHIKEGV